MPESGIARDQQPMPGSPFGRLGHFMGVAFQVLSGNPRLLLFLGINALINIVLIWTVLSSAAEGPDAEPAATILGIPLTLALSILQSFALHFLQCALLAGTLASLRTRSITITEAFQVAFARILPLAGLAILTTLLGVATQFTSAQLINTGLGIVGIPLLFAWLAWFAIDLVAIAMVVDTTGSVMAYVVGAGRLFYRTWGDYLLLLLVFVIATEMLAPTLISGIASGLAGADPSRQALLLVASISTIVRHLILSLVFVYGARLYIYTVTNR